MVWIENRYPDRFLRHVKVLAALFPPLLSLIVWTFLTFVASTRPESALAQNPLLILALSLLPLLSWIWFWRLYRIRLMRWPSRISVEEEGIIAEYGLTKGGTKSLPWSDIRDVEILEQPLGWGTIGYVVLQDGTRMMDMEIWGDAAIELQRKSLEFL